MRLSSFRESFRRNPCPVGARLLVWLWNHFLVESAVLVARSLRRERDSPARLTWCVSLAVSSRKSPSRARRARIETPLTVEHTQMILSPLVVRVNCASEAFHDPERPWESIVTCSYRCRSLPFLEFCLTFSRTEHLLAPAISSKQSKST